MEVESWLYKEKVWRDLVLVVVGNYRKEKGKSTIDCSWRLRNQQMLFDLNSLAFEFGMMATNNPVRTFKFCFSAFMQCLEVDGQMAPDDKVGWKLSQCLAGKSSYLSARVQPNYLHCMWFTFQQQQGTA